MTWKKNEKDYQNSSTHQTCTIFSKVCNIIFVISTCFHLTNFFGEEKFSWLSSKNKVADEDFHFQRHANVFVKLKCLVLELLFISHLVFRRERAEFFLSKKIRQMKPGQNKKYEITKTSSLAKTGLFHMIIK